MLVKLVFFIIYCFFISVVGKAFSWDVHALVPRNCQHVALRGKGDFADVIKVKDP